MIKGKLLKNIQARVIILMHDMSSNHALQMYEVSINYLLQFQIMGRTPSCI